MNKESTWAECIESSASLQVIPDLQKAESLVMTAEGRNKFLEVNSISENNVNYIFEGYYTSLVEIAHALLLQKGYKVANHICVGYFIRDVLKQQDLFLIFDDCRFKRNGLVYYGRKMSFGIGNEAILKCRKLMTEIKKMLKE